MFAQKSGFRNMKGINVQTMQVYAFYLPKKNLFRFSAKRYSVCLPMTRHKTTTPPRQKLGITLGINLEAEIYSDQVLNAFGINLEPSSGFYVTVEFF